MYQNLSIPHHRDPVARIVLLAIVLAPVWLGMTSAMSSATAREPSQPSVEPVIIVATPTLPVSLPTTAPAAPALAAATAVPLPVPDPIAAGIPVNNTPASQLVTNPDGSVSLPGSESWLSQQSGPASAGADPQLAIERAAAKAYGTLPTAAAPSLENMQPVRRPRPSTGR